MQQGLLGAIAGAAILFGAFLAGRASGRSDEPAPVPPVRKAPAAHAECAHPPAEPPKTISPEERSTAAGELKKLQADLRQVASDRTAQLNSLQNFLGAGLAEGKITSDQILEMFRTETDPATLDLLQGVLAANPEAADRPGVLEAFLRFATGDPDFARRQCAIAFLGSAWDKDGRVRDALLEMAGGQGDLALRLTAIGTLPAYAVKNRAQVEAVNAGLLVLARKDGNADVRAQALGAVEIRSANEAAVRQIAESLLDPAPAPRLAAAERLGETPPELRRAVLPSIESALARETQEGVKHLLLASLVRAGRADAADALRRAAARDPDLRPHAEDYLAALQKGHSDWSEIERIKADLEVARSAKAEGNP